MRADLLRVSGEKPRECRTQNYPDDDALREQPSCVVFARERAGHRRAARQERQVSGGRWLRDRKAPRENAKAETDENHRPLHARRVAPVAHAALARPCAAVARCTVLL